MSNRIHPEQVSDASCLKFIPASIAKENVGIQEVSMTPKEIMLAARASMTPEERLAFAGFSLDSSGVLTLETSTGPRHLTPTL